MRIEIEVRDLKVGDVLATGTVTERPYCGAGVPGGKVRLGVDGFRKVWNARSLVAVERVRAGGSAPVPVDGGGIIDPAGAPSVAEVAAQGLAGSVAGTARGDGQIIAEPVGCVQGWTAWVHGYEERYTSSTGATEAKAVEALLDWIECVDDGVEWTDEVTAGVAAARKRFGIGASVAKAVSAPARTAWPFDVALEASRPPRRSADASERAFAHFRAQSAGFEKRVGGFELLPKPIVHGNVASATRGQYRDGQIIAETLAASPGWTAFVYGHAERYACSWGATKEAAIFALIETIESVDDGSETPACVLSGVASCAQDNAPFDTPAFSALLHPSVFADGLSPFVAREAKCA